MALLRIHEELKRTFKSGSKRDFDTMIQAIVNTAILNKIDVKTYNHEQILNFTRKYTRQINDEFRTLDKKRIQQEKDNKNRGYYK